MKQVSTTKPRQAMRGHTEDVAVIVHLANERHIIPRQTMHGHTKGLTGVVHLPDRRRIITSSRDGSLRLWEIESGTQIGDDWRDDGDDAAVFTIALSPDGYTVASGSSDGQVRLWDVETEKVVAKWTGHTDAAGSLCWSVDDALLVSGSNDGTIRVWDVESGDTVLGPIETGHEFVCAVIYSPDTTKIATGGYKENALKIWDAKTGNLLSTIEHNSVVWSLAWTSDQKNLITGSNTSITIFDTATWQQIAILEGHQTSVYCLSLFQNDRLLASGSFDETVRLWNLDTNLPIGPPLQHQDTVQSAAISADGKLLVTGCGNQHGYVWDIHTTLKDAGLEELLSILDVSVN
jgi:WD40 repeat protein